MHAEEGSEIVIQLSLVGGEKETMTVYLTSDEAADMGAGFLGIGTPMGQALFGRQAGEVIPYPLGDIQSLEILKISVSEKYADPQRSSKRDEALRQAAAESDRTNAILFASSFNGKWGDYDPSGLMDDEEDRSRPGSPSQPESGDA